MGDSFCVVLDNKWIYTYYYCGVRNYKPKTYPTHLAVLAAMDYEINNGLKYLDSIGAEKPGPEYDLTISDRVAIAPRVTLVLASDANWSRLNQIFSPVKGKIVSENDC